MKRIISFVLALCLLLALSCAAASAAVVNTVYTREEIKREPTVYLGELVLDGETVMTYINCEDYIPSYYYGSDNSYTPMGLVIFGMDNDAFAQFITDYQDERDALLEDYNNGVISEIPDTPSGVRLCSDSDLVWDMDETWSSAAAVAAQYYPEATLTSESSENAYDIDEGFRTALAAWDEQRVADLDEPVTAEKCVILHSNANANSSVYYTVDDGEITKHVDTTVTYSSYAITVVYTRAELSAAPAAILGDADGDSTVTVLDATVIQKRLASIDVPTFLESAADADEDKSITILDATAIQKWLAHLPTNEHIGQPIAG